MGKQLVGTSRCRRAAFASALALCCLVPAPALSSLIGPSVHGLAVGATEVAVRIGPRILVFDHEGAFRREVSITEFPVERARLLALTDDGRVWFTVADLNESGDAESTTLVATDESGTVVLRHRLKGDGTICVTPQGRVFVGRVEAKRLRIEQLDTASGRLAPHAEIGIENALRILDLGMASAISWAVDEHGDIFLLTTAEEKGRVTRYRPNGDEVRVWEVTPDPVTSVAYMKDVFLGRDGVPYVTHSSWEVSSSTSNDGSVLRLDLAGGEPLRIKDGIGYLQHAGVAPSGDVFVSDLSEQIHRFSPTGERVLSWVAVPPRFAESWEERRQRIAEASRVGPSATSAELVNAVVYGQGEIPQKAERWLLAKGPAALPDVTMALLRFEKSYPLKRAAERLWGANPREAARLFEEAQDERVRRLMAASLAYADTPPAGVREVLSGMVLEGDQNARYALDHVGPTTEVVMADVGAFQRARRNCESDFYAERHLVHGYRSSIGALEMILVDPVDPDREAVRALMLEGSRELAREPGSKQKKPSPIPADVLAKTRRWTAHPDRFVRETGAITLTSFGVSGQEAEAVAAARSNSALIVPTLRALANLAAVHPDNIKTHAEALALLARHPPSPGSPDDPIGALAQISHPTVTAKCLQLLTDLSLSPERRARLLPGIEPATMALPALIALLRDQTWQRSLMGDYSYGSFLDKVLRAYPHDSEIRTAIKTALLGMLSDSRPDAANGDSTRDARARARAMVSLRPLVTASDLPQLVGLLDDPRLDQHLRAPLLWVLSQIPPDDDLRERMIQLLKDPEMSLIAAQSLGRIGHPAALEVLVEQGLKRLGYYSHIDLEIESFRPLGADAEQALLALLDYPNASTREVVRRFLVQWPSGEGRRRMRAEFDDATASGRAPDGFTVSALALAGEELVEPLLELVAEHPETMEALRIEPAEPALGEQLRRAAAKETDPARIQLLKELIRRLCADEEEP